MFFPTTMWPGEETRTTWPRWGGRLRPFSGGKILSRRSSSPNVPRIEAPNSLSTSGFVGTNPENATSVLPIMRARFCRRSIRLLTAYSPLYSPLVRMPSFIESSLGTMSIKVMDLADQAADSKPLASALRDNRQLLYCHLLRWPRDRREKLVWGLFAPKFDCETLCKPLKTMAGTTGLEPAASAVTERPMIIKYLYLQSLRNRRDT